MHGMPVAFLAGLVPSHSTLPGFEWFSPVLSPKDFCYIGLRDLDIAEKKLIRSLGMKAFTVIAHYARLLMLPKDILIN